MQKKDVKHILSFISQWVLGLTFILSGWTKGIDPFGFSLKIEDFFNLFRLSFLSELSTIVAILLSAFELFIGIMLLCGLFRRVISLFTLLFLFIFTSLTFYIYLFPEQGITDCGCFGDFIHLTNTQTFFKNIVLLLLASYYFIQTKRKTSEEKRLSFIITGYISVATLLLPIYSTLFLPIYDFLPFNRGQEINKQNASGSLKRYYSQ